jgi:hypothetical protein
MFFNKVLFAIDGNTDTHRVAKFMRHIDTYRAMGKLQGSIVHCIGSWTYDGGWTHLEPSFLMDAKDYYEVVKPFGFTDNQVCVLEVPGDTRQPCTLIREDGSQQTLRPMCETKEPRSYNNWTYVQATGKYFVC